MRRGRDHSFYNVSDNADQAVRLGELCDRVYARFMRNPAFAKHGILKPRFCDQASFDVLAGSADQFGGTVAQALTSVKPFAPQLFSNKQVQNDAAGAAMRPLDIRAILDRVCDQLTSTRWGRRHPEEIRRCA